MLSNLSILTFSVIHALKLLRNHEYFPFLCNLRKIKFAFIDNKINETKNCVYTIILFQILDVYQFRTE